jgi:hypothetical protein
MSKPSVDYPDAEVTRPDAAFENLRMLAVMGRAGTAKDRTAGCALLRFVQSGQHTLQPYL